MDKDNAGMGLRLTVIFRCYACLVVLNCLNLQLESLEGHGAMRQRGGTHGLENDETSYMLILNPNKQIINE